MTDFRVQGSFAFAVEARRGDGSARRLSVPAQILQVSFCSHILRDLENVPDLHTSIVAAQTYIVESAIIRIQRITG